jgi:hypothetical protein
VAHVESVVVASVVGEEREPLVPSRRHDRRVVVAVEVLAEQTGVIPGVVEPGRQGRGIVERGEATEGALVLPHTVRV